MTASKFTAETMQNIDSELDALLATDPPIKSNEELIAKYLDKMQAALRKGWPLDRLVEILANQGIDVKPATLRSYIQRQRKQQAALAAEAAAQAADTPARRRRSGGKKKEKQEKQQQAELVTPASASASGGFQVDSDIV